MVPFESLGTVSYSHSVATIAESLAVLTQYTNVTDSHPANHCATAKAALMQSVARQKLWPALNSSLHKAKIKCLHEIDLHTCIVQLQLIYNFARKLSGAGGTYRQLTAGCHKQADALCTVHSAAALLTHPTGTIIT